MVYAGICDRIPLTRELVIIMQIFAVPQVSGGSDCNYNADRVTETNVAKLIFIW